MAKVIIMVIGYVFCLISFLPLVRSDNWAFRVFEYPRAQKLVITLFIVCLYVAFFKISHGADIIFLTVLTINSLYLVYQVWPYTRLGNRQMRKSSANRPSTQFSLLIFNVYQNNRDVQSCLKAIRANHPDLILLVETNQWWRLELDNALKSEYKFTLAIPLENTYGMLLYSRFELVDSTIRFLVEKDVPSLKTKVKLPGGEIFQLYGLHPKPPVPHENPRSTERDAEILIVAREAANLEIPVIVAGDLNDVAWSYTTELFLKTSKLLDPRRGRGFYNTFNAFHWFLRWPLDHVFCSPHFELGELIRLPKIGSDHFPIFISLSLSKEVFHKQASQSLKASQHDLEVAEEKIDGPR